MVHEKATFILNIGYHLISHGAHATRVRNIITKMGQVVGFEDFVPNIMFTTLDISFRYQGQYYSRAIRIDKHLVDMNLISQISTITWKLNNDILDNQKFCELKDQFDKIFLNPTKKYPEWMLALSVAASCSAFCKLLGGGSYDLGISFMATLTAFYSRKYLHKYLTLNRYVVVWIITTISTIFSASLIDLSQTHYPIMSNILFLIPGVPFTNAFIDILSDRPLMGLSRLSSAILIIFCLSLGIITGLSLFGVDKL